MIIKEDDKGNLIIPKKVSTPNTVSINQLSYGWTVTIGCVSIAIAETDDREQDITDMLNEIKHYLMEPEKYEKAFDQKHNDVPFL